MADGAIHEPHCPPLRLESSHPRPAEHTTLRHRFRQRGGGRGPQRTEPTFSVVARTREPGGSGRREL